MASAETPSMSQIRPSESFAPERLDSTTKLEGDARPMMLAGSRHHSTMEGQDGIWTSVAQCLEQLRNAASTPQHKESLLRKLLDLVNTNRDARTAVSCHPQSIPVLVTMLRSNFTSTKNISAMILEILSKDEDTRIKVLLGGSIPTLLALLKSNSFESQVAAARAIYTASKGSSEDKVGPKIFATEGAVPFLWEQLKPTHKVIKPLDGILIGALRNLSSDTDGFWEETMKVGGLDILLRLIASGSSEAQSHSCYLLAKMMMEDESTCAKVMQVGLVDRLLRLLSPGNDFAVRAEAAGALKSLSYKSRESRRWIIDSNGISALVNATVAPCKEAMGGEVAQSLQENAMGALANVAGGLHSVIHSMAESLETTKSDLHVADTLGALASALMVLDEKEGSLSSVDPVAMEQVLVRQIKKHASGLIQERSIEALASLYGNKHLASSLMNSEVKKMLVGLITMTSLDVQEEFLNSFIRLCDTNSDLWYAIQGRQGVQLLISLLGVSTEEQQECAVALLSTLSQEHEDSKWAITAAGGIPPLVQLLESGSLKAKEDSAIILGNLCNHSEDIRSCVEKAGAVPALLWLLKNTGIKGQEIAARCLKNLVSKTDATTISQLNVMLSSDVPESKLYVLDTLVHFLSISPMSDLLLEGSAANESFLALVRMLGSFKEEIQQQAAKVLAKLLKDRKDIRESSMVADIISPLHKILISRHEQIAKHAAECLASLFMSIQQNPDLTEDARKTMVPLLKLCRSTALEVIERALSALANLFQDSEAAEKVPAEDLIKPLTRVLQEGTLEGKAHAARALSRLLHSQNIKDTLVEKFNRFGTILSLVTLLATARVEDEATEEALEALAILTKWNKGGASSRPLWEALVKSTESISSLVNCLAFGQPAVQNKAIEVLSKLCKDHPVLLGDHIAGTSRCITALVDRVITPPSTDVQVDAAALLICTAKEHRQQTMNALLEANCLLALIQSLVQMLGSDSDDDLPPFDDNKSAGIGLESFMSLALKTQNLQTEVTSRSESSSEADHSNHLGKTVALWLLAINAAYDSRTKCLISEAGVIEAISRELGSYSPYGAQNATGNDEGAWVSALLLAILYQEKDVLSVPEVSRTIPLLATLLKVGDSAEKYFAAEAVASLVLNGNRSTILAVANSGAPGGLIALLGSSESDNPNFLDLTKEFALVPNPAQTALEHLFRNDDIKFGSTARKVIPALVELLKPSAEKPGAPIFAQGLLALLATGSHANKLAMAEAGVLEALTRYLSLGPQDNMEECTADLLRILFSATELRCHESAVGALNQLVAVLRLGRKSARYSAGRALQELFVADHIKNNDAARQAIPPFLEMLRTGSEKEQRLALKSLSRLSDDNPPKAMVIADPETKCLETLSRILWDDCSLELKEEAAALCFVLFSYSRVRAYPTAAGCVEPLVMLLGDETARPTWLAVLYALNSLLDSESLADIAIAHGAVHYTVSMLSEVDQSIHEVTLSSLIKLGKDRLQCTLDMVTFGVFDKVVDLMPSLSDFSCASACQLLQILTDTGSVAMEVSASKIVDPLLLTLSRPGLSVAGQYSSMQVLVNILGKSEQLASYKLSPDQPIKPLILLLDSPSQPVQQLASELFSHLLVERRLDQSMISKKVVSSLVQLAATGSENMQQKSIFALETASNVLPQAVAEAGGIPEVSKVIMQLEPLPPHELWESACSVLCNILHHNPIYYWQVPVEAFVRMLQSDKKDTIVVALQGMLALGKENPSYAEAYARSGAIDALVELLRCHQCEEATAQVLESLLNDKKVRSMKTAYDAVAPLAQYLLDPESKNKPARLLSALALGDLFQQAGASASASDAMLACQALMNILEAHTPEDLRTVALCAFQNVVANGRVNKHALAESGAVDLVRNLLCSSNTETAGQAATIIKLLFSSQNVPEHASTEMIRALSVALQNELNHDALINEDIIHAISVLFSNFPKLRAADAATLCIPQLITALKAGPEAVQDASLETLYLLRQGWSGSTADITKAQASAMATAIPVLQGLIKAGTPRFQERASNLLLCLPGSLVVTIKQGKNLKQKVGSTNAFCKLTLGNGPTKETKVISHSTSPEWNQGFAWPFENAPKGQKVHIVCKNKGTFSKGTLGKVTIQVDRVIALGTISGTYTLQPDKNRDGTPRLLEIEIAWSHE